MLEIRSESAHLDAALPFRATRASLETVSANQERMFLFHVAEARNINSVGTVSPRDVILVPWNTAAGASAHAMVHHVVAQLPAGIRQPIGKFRSGGVQQDPRRLQRRGAQENNPATKLDSIAGLTVDDPDASDFTGFGIENQAMHDAVRPHRHFSRR